MIRKRIKKRRNPYEEEKLRERRLDGYARLRSLLPDIINYGNPDDLVNSIILYKQGLICYDCYNEDLGEKPKNYYKCICEKCPYCGFRRDLCYLDIEYKGPSEKDYTEEERERVKEAGYKLILEILDDDFYNDGRKYTIIPNIEFKKLYKLKREFLVSVLQKKNPDLSCVNLSRADLSYLNLSGANLSDSEIMNSNLSGANLSEANLTGTYLVDAALSDADLSDADLSRANLSRANLSGAFLFGANLSGTNLTEAFLFKTDLRKANLSEANLSGENFIEAIIKNTNFDNAKNINSAINLIIPNPRKKSIRRRK